ncbi:MAG: D-glycero-beta-D-manno-heptose-7-phosphate kinase [Syntrophobacteraceae bacterium]
MFNRYRLTAEQRERFAQALSHFSDRQVLIVGDLMLDVFVWGDVQRISPEAPVPVVDVRDETQLLGGTANVANNVAALGGKAIVSGVVGNDHSGREVVRMLRKVGIPTEGLVVEDKRPTTVKTRIIAQNQQVVRYDRELRRPLQPSSLEKILEYVAERSSGAGALIVSDYAKGVVSHELMEAIRNLDLASRFPVIVDPKIQHTELYRGVTLVTPNHHEASRMSGIEIVDTESLRAAGRKLLLLMGCQAVLITRGKDGMALFDQTGELTTIPTVARRVYDVTGAGDTVIATLALGLVAGLSTNEAALLANIAAGIVVGEVGTAVVTVDRLIEAIRDSC